MFFWTVKPDGLLCSERMAESCRDHDSIQFSKSGKIGSQSAGCGILHSLTLFRPGGAKLAMKDTTAISIRSSIKS